MIFPLAYLALTSSLTVVLIAVGLAGRAELAAELAVIQGALLATFYAFSANARNLILQGHGDLTLERLLAKRFVALPFLCVASYLLCVEAAGVSPLLALLVVARRSCEWLAEVRLCELEVAARTKAARLAFAVQILVTLGVALLLVLAPASTLPALAVFAVSPLLVSAPRPSLAAFHPSILRLTLRSVSPYIGSTAIEGISIYMLRLVVFLVAGREMSGLLFTAFVLGSFAATLFANVLGPTLALSRSRNAGARYGRFVAAAALGMGAGGAAIAGASLAAGLADWLGRPGYFWLALGLSLLGGAIMVGAQSIRLRLFDERRGEVLFGPDVLRNTAAIIAAPSLYFLVGPAALAGLYLLTALLTVFAYWGAARAPLTDASPVLRGVLAAGILLPLFFTLDGRVYHRPDGALLDPGGGVMNVPLPLSLAACFAGVVLVARYRHATLTLGTIFSLFVAMVLTSVFAAQGQIADDLRKFVLLFQFLVPAFALVLGQMLGASQQGLRIAAVGYSAVLAVLVPAQLVHSIGHGGGQLRHDLWFFSVYQHLQYVPAVVVCAFLIALFVLWEERFARWLHVALAPLVACYAASSHSALAVVLIAAGAVVFAAVRWRDAAARLCAVLVAVSLTAYVYLNGSSWLMPEEFEQARLYYWKLYGSGIVESGRQMLFGHAKVMDRSLAPSAHNYYLDFVYNFGVLAFLPFAWLVGYTLMLLWRQRACLWRHLPILGLALGVLFVLALDNMFKVPLRQPYSGIFFFFIWGLLIARLQALPAAARVPTSA